MTSDAERMPPAARPEPKQRRSPVAVTAVVVGIVIVATIAFANVWTEWQWYAQVGFSQVLRTQWIAKAVTFLIFGLIAGGAVWLTLWIARRARPERGGRPALDQYREQVRPIERVVMWAAPIFVGVIAGAVMAGHWARLLAWLHATSFGFKDPQFGLDASFYVFTLPVLHSFVSFYLTILILCTALATFVHLLYGGISGGGRSFVASRGARIQLAIMGALVMVGVAANYWLQRYSLLNKVGEKFYGASYTDVNAILPSRGILVGIALLVAAVFLLVIWRPDWRIPAVGVGLMLVAAIAIGGIYPAIVQRFQVEPSAKSLEAPYLQRNIDATRDAYGSSEVDGAAIRRHHRGRPAASGDAETTASIRIIDPDVVAPAFAQLSSTSSTTSSPSTSTSTATDRRRDPDTVIAVRELNLDGLGATPPQLGQRHPRLHPRLRRGRRVRQPAVNLDGQPKFIERGIPDDGRPRRVRAARLLR